MSFKIIGKAFDIPLKGNDKLVFLALCEYADDENNQCYPSIATIMKKATISKSVATRCLNILEYLGYIVRDKRKRENGSNTSTLYTVNVDIALDKDKYKEATLKFRSVNRDNQSSESGQGANTTIGTTKVQNRDNQSSESGQLESLDEPLDESLNKKNTKKSFSFTLSKSSQYKDLSQEYKDSLEIYALLKDKANKLNQFLDYHLAKASKFSDWSRAYNTWIHNAKKIDAYRPEDYKPCLMKILVKAGTSTKEVNAYDCGNCLVTEDGIKLKKKVQDSETIEDKEDIDVISILKNRQGMAK